MERTMPTRRLAWLAMIGAALLVPVVSSAQESTAAANSDDWVSVAISDRTEVFARPSSLHWDGAWLQGAVVQKTKIGEKNLKWMDAAPDTVFGALLDYACGQAPPAPSDAQADR
jgi:hypothetical protein